MMKLGFNCAGTEKVFEEVMEEAIMGHFRHGRFSPFNYIEVGIAEGTTLGSVSDHLQTSSLPEWNALGIDLLDGPYFNPIKWMREFRYIPCQVLHPPIPIIYDFSSTSRGTRIHLSDHGLVDIQFKNTQFHLALIDGCHGAPCVENDFNHIEPLMARGGIVAFHDALPEDQDRDFQPHCQMPISVRKALGNLGLLQGSRPGWEFVTEVAGDKSANPPGNGFMFFRRI